MSGNLASKIAVTSAEIPPLPHKTLRSQVFAGTPIQEMDSGKCRDKCTFYASVAQSVEQGTENPRVIGSIPIGGTTSKILSFIGKSCRQDFCDEYQIFSFSPQNLVAQAFAGTPLEIRVGGCRDKCTGYAAVAHLVERHLAKVEVASSSLVGRSNTKPSLMQKCKSDGFFVSCGNGRECPQRRASVGSGAATAVSHLEPTCEKRAAERPQAFRCSEI